MRRNLKNIFEAINMANRLVHDQLVTSPTVEKKAGNSKGKPKPNNGKKPKKGKVADTKINASKIQLD